MTATVAQLADRVLRRLGIVIVADSAALSGTVTTTAIATRALQIVGLVIPAAQRTLNPALTLAADIAWLVLQRLGVIASDEVQSPTDQATAFFAVNAVHDALVGQGLVSWTSDTIPRAVAEEYIVLASIQLASVFGKVADPTQTAVMEARIKHVALVMEAETLAEAQVQAVHQSLLAQGFISWVIGAVPEAVFEDYAQLTAMQLSSMFGPPMDTKAAPSIEARVRQVAMVMGARGLAAQKVMAVHANLAARGKIRWSVLDLPDYLEQPYIEMASFLLAPEFAIKADPNWWAQGEMTINRFIALPSSGESVVAAYF